jgi:hypothetical protein
MSSISQNQTWAFTRVEKFGIGPYHLNLSACASSDLPQPKPTPQLEEAIAYVARLRKTDEELQEDHPSTSAQSGV